MNSKEKPEKESSYSVLIIEDDADLVELFSMALEINGYEVDGATTIEKGRTMLNGGSYDLLLCDMQVGEDKSIKFLREVVPQLKDTQVVMISGTGQYQTMAGDIGVDFFLVKPIPIPVLVSLADRLTGKSTASLA